MKRFALRRKSDGKYLSAKVAYGSRKWVELNATYGPFPALFTGRSALSNAACYTKEYIQYFLQKNNLSVKLPHSPYVRFSTKRGVACMPDCPVEVVEFDMLLIQGGILTAKDVKEQL